MTDPTVAGVGADRGASRREDERELLREGATMAVYVAISLLAVLVALEERASHGDGRAVAIVWGTSAGLALAHFYAFSIAARLAAETSPGPHDLAVSVAQVLGAVFVAAVVSIPVALFPATSQFDVARLLLALIVGGAGYLVVRGHGGSRLRSLVAAVGTLAFGVAVALLKNVLSGH